MVLPSVLKPYAKITSKVFYKRPKHSVFRFSEIKSCLSVIFVECPAGVVPVSLYHYNTHPWHLQDTGWQYHTPKWKIMAQISHEIHPEITGIM